MMSTAEVMTATTFFLAVIVFQLLDTLKKRLDTNTQALDAVSDFF